MFWVAGWRDADRPCRLNQDQEEATFSLKILRDSSFHSVILYAPTVQRKKGYIHAISDAFYLTTYHTDVVLNSRIRVLKLVLNNSLALDDLVDVKKFQFLYCSLGTVHKVYCKWKEIPWRITRPNRVMERIWIVMEKWNCISRSF